MKCTLSTSDLLAGLAQVRKAAPKLTALPNLNSVLIEATGDGVRLAMSNLETCVLHTIPATVEEPGSCLIPAWQLARIVRRLDSPSVTIVGGEKQSTITVDGFTATVRSDPPSEFPPGGFPDPIHAEGVLLPAGVLRQVWERLGRLVALPDETRAILCSVQMHASEGTLHSAATDGRVAGVFQCPCDVELPVTHIPGQMLQVASRANGSPVAIASNGISVSLSWGRTQVTSRVETLSRFPNVAGFIAGHDARVSVAFDRNVMRAAVDRLLAIQPQDTSNKTVCGRVEIGSSSLQMSFEDIDIGSESRVRVPCDLAGEDTVLGVNPRYLLRVLNSMPPGRLEWSLAESLSSTVIRGEDPTLVCALMPARLAEPRPSEVRADA